MTLEMLLVSTMEVTVRENIPEGAETETVSEGEVAEGAEKETVAEGQVA